MSPAANKFNAGYRNSSKNTRPSLTLRTLDAVKAITPIANTARAIRIANGGHRIGLGASLDLPRVDTATSERGRPVGGSVVWVPEVLAGNELTTDTVESVGCGNAYGNGRSGAKLRIHWPPSRLAVYMAKSACRRSWSTVEFDVAASTVKPMLGRTSTGTPSITITVLNAWRTRWAAACSNRSRKRARLARPVRLSRKASRATSDNKRWFSTSTTSCRASTAAA